MRSRRVSLALLIGMAAACNPMPPPPAPVADRGAVPLLAVDGSELRTVLGGIDADVVLLNVWATWCVTCREEFPDLLRLRERYRDRGLAVEFLSGDFPSQAANAAAFLHELEVDFPTYIKAGKDMELIEALHPGWSGALPATFFFGRDGSLLQWWEGAATYDVFAAAADAALARVQGAQR